MDDIKDALARIAIIIFIIAGGLTILGNIFVDVFNAICWIVSFDFKDTGLPYMVETIIKMIVEGIILALAASLGISKKNPLVSLAVIVIGFAVCVMIYFIKQYILWIMIGALVLVAAYITYLIISSKKEKNKGKKKINKKEKNLGGEVNNESI